VSHSAQYLKSDSAKLRQVQEGRDVRVVRRAALLSNSDCGEEPTVLDPSVQTGTIRSDGMGTSCWLGKNVAVNESAGVAFQ